MVGQEIYKMDCMHHLRNVWFKGVEKAITSHLNSFLKDSLDTIDSSLRVSASMSAPTRAFDKEFSLCANYPKGHGMLFCQWMKKLHPGELLLHVERATGSKQDLFLEGAPAIFWNRQYCIEFLDEQLRIPDKGNIFSRKTYLLFYPHWRWLLQLDFAQYFFFLYVYPSSALQEIVILCTNITGVQDQWVGFWTFLKINRKKLTKIQIWFEPNIYDGIV